jgi:hypothetical protein
MYEPAGTRCTAPHVAPRHVIAIASSACVALEVKPMKPLAPKTGNPSGRSASFVSIGHCLGLQIDKSGASGAPATGEGRRWRRARSLIDPSRSPARRQRG